MVSAVKRQLWITVFTQQMEEILEYISQAASQQPFCDRQTAWTAGAAFVFIPRKQKMTVYNYKGSIMFRSV